MFCLAGLSVRRGLMARGVPMDPEARPVRRDPEVQAFPLCLALRQDLEDQRDRRRRPCPPRRSS